MSAPPTLTERHPPLDLDEVVSRIHAFDDAGPQARAETIDRFVAAHPVLSYRWGGGWRYRRARRFAAGDRPTSVGGLIWREDVPAAPGRANAAGFTVLYLADRRDTALSEVRVDDGLVVLTEFTIRPDRSILVAPIGELSQVQRTGRGLLSAEAGPILNDLINACDIRSCRSMIIVDAFLLEGLTNQGDDYGLSSAVAMAIYAKLPGLDAIAFPSRRQTGAINFAVRPEGIWRDWGIVSVREARVRHLAMGHYELTCVRHVRGIATSGDLAWEEGLDTDGEAIQLLDPPWYPARD